MEEKMTLQACLTKHSGFDLETSGLERFFHQATQVAFTEPAVNLIERTKIFSGTNTPLSNVPRRA